MTIFEFHPSKINLIFFLNSSETSFAQTGLTFVDKLALGIANGKLIFFKTDLTIG